MIKISKEMRLILVVVAIGGPIAYMMSAGSDAPAVVHKPHMKFGNTTTQTDASAITPADLTAHFNRYPGGSRNPFMPVIVSAAALAAGSGKSASTWALTGINTIDGVTTALVENSVTGESEFLKVGDHWNGLTVASVGSDSATFIDPYGKVTQLSFPENAPDTTEAGGAPSPQTPQPNIPLPVSGTVPTGGIPPFPVTNVAPLGPAQQN